jgi:hypothetical protein
MRRRATDSAPAPDPLLYTLRAVPSVVVGHRLAPSGQATILEREGERGRIKDRNRQNFCFLKGGAAWAPRQHCCQYSARFNLKHVCYRRLSYVL